MNATTTALKALFNSIPRRHSADNVKEIYNIVSAYEDLLKTIEAENSFYEENTPVFFNHLDTVKTLIKKSTENKASKKMKDHFFDEASGELKDSMEQLTVLYSGERDQ